ncbi:MAG: putative esterase YcpF (UPF0227 family) [Glaciecola sp.]|jgi:predicted esterase YcpF (UPF0227 family)
MKNIIYLHGFLSSPKSTKAQLTLNYITKHHPDVVLHIPTLPGNPFEAVVIIKRLVENLTVKNDLPTNQLRFIGSSMGGFLSTFCVETYGGKAVLINPAVEPFNLLVDYFGHHQNPYTGEDFTIDENSVAQLQKLNRTTKINNPNYLVYLQTADETLDYQLAVNKYGKDRCVVEDGGNHSFVGLDKHLDSILDFLLE